MLNLADVLDRLQCCYLETVTQNIENAVTLITDDVLVSKQNDLFNLIHIFEDIDWDNKAEVNKYLIRINEKCGCDFVYEPVFITETDSPSETFTYQWIGDKPTCIKQPEIWIGIDEECVVEGHNCNACEECEKLYEWIPIEEYCVEGQPAQPEEPCGCDE